MSWFFQPLPPAVLLTPEYSLRAYVEAGPGGSGLTTFDAPNFTAVAGDCLIAVVTSTSADVSVTLSDTVGSNDTWTEVASGIYNAPSTRLLRAFVLPVATAGSCTVRATFGSAINAPAIFVLPVTYLATLPLDQGVFVEQTAAGGIDELTVSTSTLARAPAMIFGFSIRTSSAPDAGTGFTNIGLVWANARAEHKRVTVTTATAATFTPTLTGIHLNLVIALSEYYVPVISIPTAVMAPYFASNRRL